MLSSVTKPTNEKLLEVYAKDPDLASKVDSLCTGIESLKLDRIPIYQRGTVVSIDSLNFLPEILNDINEVITFIKQDRAIKFIMNSNYQDLFEIDREIFEQNKRYAQSLKKYLAKMDIEFSD